MVNILFQLCARLAAILSTESANNLEAASKSDQNSTEHRDSSRHYKMRHLVDSPVQKVYLALGLLGYSYSTYEIPTFSYELWVCKLLCKRNED